MLNTHSNRKSFAPKSNHLFLVNKTIKGHLVAVLELLIITFNFLLHHTFFIRRWSLNFHFQSTFTCFLFMSVIVKMLVLLA